MMPHPTQRLCTALASGCLILSLAAPARAALHPVLTDYAVGTGFQALAEHLADGDFNGDGTLDLVTADLAMSDGTFSVLIGHGDGSFEPAELYEAPGAASVAVGDFDEDGLSDVVAPAQSGNAARVFFSNGDETFGFIDVPTIIRPNSVAVGDFNHNGHDDLAAVGNDGLNADVTVSLGAGTGSFGAAAPYPVGGNGIESVAVGDFNGDGRDDLVAIPGVNGAAQVFLSNADGTLQAPKVTSVGGSPGDLAVGLFNADARSDVAVTNVFSNPVSVLLSASDGTLATPTGFAATASSGPPAVGDFNHDGHEDIVVAGSSGTVAVLLGAGDGTFPTRQDFASAGVFRGALAFDANDDGFDDVGLIESQTNSVIVGINAPWILSSADALSFGGAALGTTTASQALTITNDGVPPLSFASIGLGGADPGDFRITSDACTGSSLSTGATCAVAVAAVPSASGTRGADLIIASNAGQGVKHVALGAEGIATTTLAASAVSPRDTIAPVATIGLIKQGLRRVIARGYQATVGCSEPCRFALRLLVNRSLAHRLHIAAVAPVAIGAATGRLTAPGQRKVVVKLTKRARSRLKGQRRLKLTLEVRVTDAAQNARTIKRTVLLGR
jgi:FG-GAP-like repeat